MSDLVYGLLFAMAVGLGPALVQQWLNQRRVWFTEDGEARFGLRYPLAFGVMALPLPVLGLLMSGQQRAEVLIVSAGIYTFLGVLFSGLMAFRRQVLDDGLLVRGLMGSRLRSWAEIRAASEKSGDVVLEFADGSSARLWKELDGLGSVAQALLRRCDDRLSDDARGVLKAWQQESGR